MYATNEATRVSHLLYEKRRAETKKQSADIVQSKHWVITHTRSAKYYLEMNIVINTGKLTDCSLEKAITYSTDPATL